MREQLETAWIVLGQLIDNADFILFPGGERKSKLHIQHLDLSR